MEPCAWCVQPPTLPGDVSAQRLSSPRNFQTAVWLPVKFVVIMKILACVYSWALFPIRNEHIGLGLLHFMS